MRVVVVVLLCFLCFEPTLSAVAVAAKTAPVESDITLSTIINHGLRTLRTIQNKNLEKDEETTTTTKHDKLLGEVIKNKQDKDEDDVEALGDRLAKGTHLGYGVGLTGSRTVHGQHVKTSYTLNSYLVTALAATIVIICVYAAVSSSTHDIGKAKQKCTWAQIATLGASGTESVQQWFRLVAPFANEMANVLTLTTPLDLYPHHTINIVQLLEKTLIDTIALIGIIANASHYAFHVSELIGVLKGLLLLMFTFVLPNIAMGPLLSGGKRSFWNPKLLLGLVVIYILDFSVNWAWCSVVGDVTRYHREPGVTTPIHEEGDDDHHI